MIPLSVTIIARDEADRIGDAIRSVRALSDDVVVLDSGSIDATVSIARNLGARVIETDWPGYVAQKNRALRYVRHDWVLAIDADERVSPELALEVRRVLAREPGVVGFTVPRLGFWEGRPIRHGTWYPDTRVRLFRRDRARWTGRDPHDHVVADGPVGHLSAPLHHFPFRHLGEHLQQVDRYSRLMAEGARAAGERAHWWDVVFRPILHFVKGYLLRMGFLDGVRGFCVASFGAAYVLSKWSRLYFADRAGEAAALADEAPTRTEEGIR